MSSYIGDKRHMPKVSIIIPVYNSAPYIERCLQSVESQSLIDIEVLLIDNCGNDDIMTIAQSFIARQHREDIAYRIASTGTNTGPADARNLGLSLAKGEYVAFLDADDWVEPDMYEQLYLLAAPEADMACGNLIQDYEDGRTSRLLKNTHMPQGEISISGRKRLLMRFVSYFTTFIYRRQWLNENGICFPDTKSAEDSSFLTCCLLSAGSIKQVDKPLYHYMIHAGSLTTHKRWKGRDKRKAFSAVIDYAHRQGLMPAYRWQLYYIYVKKALVVPILEML